MNISLTGVISADNWQQGRIGGVVLWGVLYMTYPGDLSVKIQYGLSLHMG